MEKNSEIMQESFHCCVQRYKDSMRYSRGEPNRFRRVLFGLKTLGLPYVFHTLTRCKIPGLWGDAEVPLFFGRKLFLPRADIGSHSLAMYGLIPHRSERRLTQWMLKHLVETDVFYDVGAHLGFYTALAEALVTSGEVHAFEANKTLCTYLKKNFRMSSSVNVTCSAVASAPGMVDFYDATLTRDSSTSSRFNIAGSSLRPSKVDAITLDEYVHSGKKMPTVIKFDIEGGEYDAILGAVSILQKKKPRIILEVWGGELGKKYSQKAVARLFELGYQAFSIDGGGSIHTDPVLDPVGVASTMGDFRDNFVFISSKKE